MLISLNEKKVKLNVFWLRMKLGEMKLMFFSKNVSYVFFVRSFDERKMHIKRK